VLRPHRWMTGPDHLPIPLTHRAAARLAAVRAAAVLPGVDEVAWEDAAQEELYGDRTRPAGHPLHVEPMDRRPSGPAA
jgi:hypothetical protein